MTGRHASTTRQAWTMEMVRSVDGASWRKAEYSYRLEGVWGNSPMVRPLIYDRAWLTENNLTHAQFGGVSNSVKRRPKWETAVGLII